MTSERLKALVAGIIVLLIGGAVGVVIVNKAIEETRQYWHQSPTQTWEHAPDGWYHVSGGSATENGKVFFPMCESSGTQLHGVWESVIFLPEGFDGEVRLENEVIVEAMKI